MIIRFKDTDRVLILTTLFLVVAGIMMVYSTSYIMAMERFKDEYFFLKRHLSFTLIGLAGFFITMHVPYRAYKKMAYPLLVAATILLSLVFVDVFGVDAGGARRWLEFGSVRFQPSELAKVAVVIFLAYSLEAKRDKIKTFSLGVVPHILIPALPIVLILLEPDFGTSMVITAVIFLMMFIAGVRITHLVPLGVMSLPLIYYLVAGTAYRMRRILIFLNPWKDPTGEGFQIVQSLIAIGSGGLYGVGFGEGRQKLFYLPEAHTDFIFSVIGEEFGIIGVLLVFILYLSFLLCGVRAAWKSPDLFGTYLASGLTSLIVLQAVINVGIVMGLLPPKGLPLPFISYGGTSLVVNMAMAGIVLNIYKKGCEG